MTEPSPGEPSLDKTIDPLTTPAMEVHHHGHVQHNKKWKDYLFQFFMLFLAVFCGMLSEYLLEHIVEHNKEEQYIQSFIRNIKDDTAELRLFIKVGKEKEKGLDSLLAISKGNINDSSNRKAFYKWSIKTLFTIPTFSSNDATSIQLRNSGGYRLIQKRGVADSLTAYDQLNKLVNIQAGYYSGYFNQANELWQRVIDLTIVKDTSYVNSHGFTGKPLPEIIMDPTQKLQFNNKIIFFGGVLKNYNKVLEVMLDYATRLIAFLQKKYNVKEE